MKRFGQVVIGTLMAVACSGAASAQTTAEGKWSVQADTAAVLGHSSSASFGGEVDYRWRDAWELAFEVGHMGNIATGDLEDRAQIVGDALGVTADPTQSAVYYDFGIRYRLLPEGKWNPYAAIGFGAAYVNTDTDFDGADLSNVQLGTDLDGSITKAFFLIGTGVTVPFKAKYFFDGSLRYGRVFAREGEIEGDTGNNTFRIQVGVGLKF